MDGAEKARLSRELRALLGGPHHDMAERALAAIAGPPTGDRQVRIVARLQAAQRCLTSDDLKAAIGQDITADKKRTSALLAVASSLRWLTADESTEA